LFDVLSRPFCSPPGSLYGNRSIHSTIDEHRTMAWYGPIVMNTQEQLRDAFTELEKGTSLKTKND
jgi:hypothetical protein